MGAVKPLSVTMNAALISLCALLSALCTGVRVVHGKPGGSSFGGMYTMKRNSGNSVYAFDMGDSGDYEYQGNQKNKLQYTYL